MNTPGTPNSSDLIASWRVIWAAHDRLQHSGAIREAVLSHSMLFRPEHRPAAIERAAMILKVAPEMFWDLIRDARETKRVI